LNPFAAQACQIESDWDEVGGIFTLIGGLDGQR
jgi:hypothetical protein